MKKLLSLLILSLAITGTAQAALKIDITQGNVDPMPIAINDFYDESGVATSLGRDIREIIENDLKNSGLFRPISHNAFLEKPQVDQIPAFTAWRQIGALAVSTGKITESGSTVSIEFRLWDPSLEEQIAGTQISISERSWRRLGHKVADEIYKKLTGEDGIFDTRVLFISESGPMNKRMKKLAIMDQDGENYRELTNGKYMVLTPRFDSKSQRAIYMSYEKRVPQVYLLDINSGSERLIGRFPGMSFAPRFSPDGSDAILSIAKHGTTDIYEVNLSSSNLSRLTNMPGTINTSPSYSPDGDKIVFNSDRGGAPQLYVMNRDGSGATRISFGGGSYFNPVWSPRGDYIAFTKKSGPTFYIGVMRPDGSGERLLTSSWMDEGPTWSPNGRVIMFSRQQRGGGYHIYAVDITGYHERRIKTPHDASDPAWSPLLG